MKTPIHSFMDKVFKSYITRNHINTVDRIELQTFENQTAMVTIRLWKGEHNIVATVDMQPFPSCCGMITASRITTPWPKEKQGRMLRLLNHLILAYSRRRGYPMVMYCTAAHQGYLEKFFTEKGWKPEFKRVNGNSGYELTFWVGETRPQKRRITIV